MPMHHHRQFIEQLVAKGGPEPEDYQVLDEWVSRVHNEVATGLVSESELLALRDSFGDALSPATMQGFALRKPHGYAGDFEIIDRIYRQHIASEPHLASWDRYYHQHAAPKAVRNRKAYFHQVLDRHYNRRTALRVLNVASGPGRCIFEWLSARKAARVSFRCIELDPKAIAYASSLNEPFLDRVSFVRMNALRFRPNEQFDLVWASGIFDYFTDAVAQSLLRRLILAVAPDGEVVIGNFSDKNPSRDYMELVGDWRLHHRSADNLAALAISSGASAAEVFIGAEPEGVNLFLHITNRLAPPRLP